MVIQHNMNAMNSSRQLGLVTRSLAKSTEKLSSGYKINRAADDAAGLSISEKMRKQVRGLNQASENIEDGISLCQVADGALNETVAILQRMRELAVQSANGTNSASDRQSIEMEVTQLKAEVDRIAVTTKFNDAVYPLNAHIMDNDMVAGTNNNPPENNPSGIVLYEHTVTFITGNSCIYDGKVYDVGDSITITGITSNGCEIWCDGGGADFMNGTWVTGGVFETIKASDLKIDKDGHIYHISKGGYKRYAIYNENDVPDPLVFWETTQADNAVKNMGYHYFTADNLLNKPKPINQTVTKPTYNQIDSTSIHAGASSAQKNKIPVHIVNATCRGLEITDLTVATEDRSTEALKLLDKALSRASAYRSAFGATQNRLEHAEKIDDNTAENTQAAESQIRDTEMAAEMVRYSNTSILSQAGQSMLAQANQSKQGILSLVA